MTSCVESLTRSHFYCVDIRLFFILNCPYFIFKFLMASENQNNGNYTDVVTSSVQFNSCGVSMGTKSVKNPPKCTGCYSEK